MAGTQSRDIDIVFPLSQVKLRPSDDNKMNSRGFPILLR